MSIHFLGFIIYTEIGIDFTPRWLGLLWKLEMSGVYKILKLNDLKFQFYNFIERGARHKLSPKR